MLHKTKAIKVIFFVIFSCGLSTSKKLRSPVLDNLKKDKLNECERCKVLTESFNHWMKATSRGKYEGGDAAWEEIKLKTYARSEIRLVEIQEGLCSELSKYQDYCYSLSEEAELILEKWWFDEDPHSRDLYTWLCIETMKYCCPTYHFGDICTPCPLDNDNNICSGNGKCDGDGTRTGNGTCNCNRGYKGKHCNECADNYFSHYSGTCEQCHQACVGCSADGPAACYSCNPGWHLDTSGICVDINECLSPTICKNNEHCVNKEGSYKCRPCDPSCNTCQGLGSKNCSSCVSPRQLWDGMCITRSVLEDILINSMKRLTLYIVLILTTIIVMIYTTNHNLSPIILIIIAILAYFFEKRSNINTFEILFSVFKNYDQAQVYSDFMSIKDRMFAHLL